jgi:hypothetical protein
MENIETPNGEYSESRYADGRHDRSRSMGTYFRLRHATLPIEDIYPRIGSFVGFHPIVELPLTFLQYCRG